MKQCINIWLVFVLFASYLYSICYCHLPPSLGDVWSEIYLFSNIKRDFFGSVSRISSQLLFCISCPSVMRFAVSGINKQSGGSGNITECKSQGPKLICARFGDLGGGRSYICTVLSWLGRDMVGRDRHQGRHVVPPHVWSVYWKDLFENISHNGGGRNLRIADIAMRLRRGLTDRVPFDLEKVTTCREPRVTAILTGRGMKITGNTKAHLIWVFCVWCLKSENVWLGGWSKHNTYNIVIMGKQNWRTLPQIEKKHRK